MSFQLEQLTPEEEEQLMPYRCPYCGSRYSERDTFQKCKIRCKKHRRNQHTVSRRNKKIFVFR